jgi:hypothetical protein
MRVADLICVFELPFWDINVLPGLYPVRWCRRSVSTSGRPNG